MSKRTNFTADDDETCLIWSGPKLANFGVVPPPYRNYSIIDRLCYKNFEAGGQDSYILCEAVGDIPLN